MNIIFPEREFSVFDFASCISDAIDLVSPALNNHHKKVAYVSYCIAEELNLTDEEIKDIVLAAILHDIGAFTDEERLQVINSQFNDSEYDQHCIVGYQLFADFEPLSNAASLIRHHHAHYNEKSDSVPFGSYILHLADRISSALNDNKEVLEQVPVIMESIDKNRNQFHPDTLEALSRLEKYEFFWIEACSHPLSDIVPDRMRAARNVVDLDTLRGFAMVFARFIDYRSRFTSTHSSGVAAVAKELSRISGFSSRECALMEIAGFLHDLGKLAIPSEILEKNSSLTHEEFNEMRKHTYYTYIILNKIKGLEHISTWAAYHHEKLNGNGYPFHVKGDDFSKLARIMAVADIFTAITEDRPYRDGMTREETMRVLHNMVDNGSVDSGIVQLVEENYDEINNVRIGAQQEALSNLW